MLKKLIEFVQSPRLLASLIFSICCSCAEIAGAQISSQNTTPEKATDSSDTKSIASVVISRAMKAPQLQDYIKGEPAQHGVKITDFKQRVPGDGNPISKPTAAYLSYDDAYFYAVFVAKDDPALVRAHIGKREDIDGDDIVILELDTFRDKRHAFTFFVNPYGVQLDAKRTEGFDLDVNFDTQWESEGQLTEDGYVVRIAIPFKSLRYKSADVQTWGVSVGRVISRLGEEAFWPTLTKRVAGLVPQFSEVQIPEKLNVGRNAQLNPFVLARNSKVLDAENLQNPLWQRENKVQGGLDAKWVLGDAAALDITLKPDFSDVDSDDPQIVVGKRYEVLFPEKRPFFLENASFFQTPNPLFFSRRIAQPTAGVRITGRADTWSYGSLLIDDDLNSDTASGKAKIAVARAQTDLRSDWSIGALLTDRRDSLDRETVFGFDTRYQYDDNWIFQAQSARSQKQEQSNLDKTDVKQTDVKQTDAHLNFLEAKHSGKHLEYLAKYVDISNGFANTLAFLPRTDYKQLHQEMKLIQHIEDGDALQRYGIVVNSDWTRNQQNTLQDWVLDAGILLEGSHNSWFEVFSRNSFEKYEGKSFDKRGWFISTGTEWLDWLRVIAEFGVGDAINYTPASGVAAGVGRARSMDLLLSFKPHPQWRIEEKLLWNDLRQDGLVGSSANVFRNTMLRTKLSYQMTRFLGLRLIADYHVLSANPTLSSLTSGKQLNTDFQINYTLSPGTSVIAGYGNRQENLAQIGNPGYLVRTEDLQLRTGRRAFIKLNYLYQF
ncbi:DUF5916 domain-containing protein [Undibacterium cyanobacteriorum]|uniref:DUF5916 domain-containing protein n=1 Tax=Undibacterium cyanobacteriorum TaxID=3073561 RepID=A0ABY9RH71_9BURK|nr:DUF5916 domain-containing protein [Undibacterium sp. 20NA77.5]WMW79630.1 DUF5916 domain-containing protein [Undibacterium sp. 20NA77.5]